MKKRFFTLLLAVAASAGTMFAEKVQIGDLYYNLDDINQTAEVTYKSYTNYQYNKGWGITTANIPSSVIYNGVSYIVTNIGLHAFDGCSGLTSIGIPNTVTNIGLYAFMWCRSLTSVTIPNSVDSIGRGAFSGCTGLTSVTIPNSVTSIGRSAFDGCTGLTSVTIPNSVDSIGDEAFYLCRGLTSVTIGNSVTSIGHQAFYGCSGLTSVTIPNSVTSIGSSAFMDCSGLTSVTIGNSVTEIGYQAFYQCSGLTSVTIPNSVTSIGGYAFYKCTGLTSVTIGNSVTNIGEEAFGFRSGLSSVTCFATTPPQYYWVFSDISSCVLYVPAGSISAYQSDNGWKVFSNILPIGAQPADVTTTTVTPSATTADIAWPQVTGAATYTIEIKKNGELICTLTFNAEGQLISITLAAPSRNNAPQRAQAAGFSFTVTSLDSGTTYSYTMTAKDNGGNVLKTESGTFTTTGESQGFEDVQSEQVQGSKILRDGQIFILRGEKEYTVTGQEVK